jgi:predicted dehydrogenase
MISAADAADRFLMVAHERRFRTRQREVQRLLAGGELGDIIHIRLDDIQDKRGQFRRSPWYASAEAGRTALVGTGIHEVDLLRFYVGRPITRVFALSNHVGSLEFPADTTTSALFEFECGAIGQVTVTYEAHWPATGLPRHSAMIVGSEGLIVDALMSRDGQEACIGLPDDAQGIVTGTHGCVDAFVNSIVSGEQVPVDGRDGFRSLAACVAADEAAATRSPVVPAEP